MGFEIIGTSHLYTPPKYQQAQQEREAALKLEDRLWEFIKWLQERNVEFGSRDGRIPDYQINRLVEEYVNT